MNETVRYPFPAVGANDGTVTLFNSVTTYGKKMLRLLNMTMLDVIFLQMDQATAANGLKAYASTDGGVNWRQLDYESTMPKALAALAASTDHHEKFDVSPFDDFKLELTHGATAPTSSAWEGIITGHFGQGAVQK